MDCALYAGGSWKGDLLVADLETLQENDASQVCVERISTNEVVVPKRRRQSHFPMCKWFGEYGSKKVLESDHTTELGKIPKKGKDSSVIFKEKRTNQILHTIIVRPESKACFFGVSLEASLAVITFKIHKKHFASGELVSSPTH